MIDPEPLSQNDSDGWRRVHPVTPLLRSWRVLAVLAVVVLNWRGDDVLRGQAPDLRADLRWVGVGLGVVLVALLASGVLSYASWRFTRFRVDGDALELHTGVLFRQHRRARLDRVESVDVAQPLIARLAGLARLTVEAAGGRGSSITLAYLTEDDAARLRAELLARAAGVRFEGADVPRAPESQVLEVPVNRLIWSLVLSAPTIVLGVLVIGSAVMAPMAGASGLLAVLGPLVVVGSMHWRRFERGFGFRVASSPDGLRVRFGLLEQRAQTVPPGRVQAVRVRQPLLWRAAGWWQVQVNVAGYAGDSEAGEQGQVLLPVGPFADVVAVLAQVLPSLGVEDDEHPSEVVAAGLTGTAAELGFVVAPARAWPLDPIGLRRIGFRVTREALLLRSGALVRRLDVVLHARTQSLRLHQGGLQRRLGLATFAVHSTPGPVQPTVAHLDAAVAARLLDDQAARARTARGAAGPQRWMERPLT